MSELREGKKKDEDNKFPPCAAPTRSWRGKGGGRGEGGSVLASPLRLEQKHVCAEYHYLLLPRPDRPYIHQESRQRRSAADLVMKISTAETVMKRVLELITPLYASIRGSVRCVSGSVKATRPPDGVH